MEIYHPNDKVKINNYELSIINLRDETEIKESYFKLYDYLVEYVKNLIVLNNNFRKFYKKESPKYAELLDKINNLVNLYYSYDDRMLTKEEIIHIFNNTRRKLEEAYDIRIIMFPYIELFKEKIKNVIKDEQLKFVTNDDLIKNKQKSMKDMFIAIGKFVEENYDIENYEVYINKIIEDIKEKIEKYTQEEKIINPFEYNKENIRDEIKNSERTLLKYIYSKNLLYFNNYLHHIKNIYLGVRYYLQRGYMNKRYQKYDVEIYNKFYCCLKDEKSNLIMGMIINKYKDKDEYLQEHIFISNNIKYQVFENKEKIKGSMILHSYASNLIPLSNKVYCNPMPSMLKIFKELDKEGKIKINYLSDEERQDIIKKQIICFKFPPIISIEVDKELQEYYLKNW